MRYKISDWPRERREIGIITSESENNFPVKNHFKRNNGFFYFLFKIRKFGSILKISYDIKDAVAVDVYRNSFHEGSHLLVYWALHERPQEFSGVGAKFLCRGNDVFAYSRTQKTGQLSKSRGQLPLASPPDAHRALGLALPGYEQWQSCVMIRWLVII